MYCNTALPSIRMEHRRVFLPLAKRKRKNKNDRTCATFVNMKRITHVPSSQSNTALLSDLLKKRDAIIVFSSILGEKKSTKSDSLIDPIASTQHNATSASLIKAKHRCYFPALNYGTFKHHFFITLIFLTLLIHCTHYTHFTRRAVHPPRPFSVVRPSK